MDGELLDRIRSLHGWELVREGRLLQKRYRTPNMAAALAFARFAAQVADAHRRVPAIIPGIASVQVRIEARDGQHIREEDVDLAAALDLDGQRA